jgi:hypothetical protein
MGRYSWLSCCSHSVAAVAIKDLSSIAPLSDTTSTIKEQPRPIRECPVTRSGSSTSRPWVVSSLTSRSACDAVDNRSVVMSCAHIILHLNDIHMTRKTAILIFIVCLNNNICWPRATNVTAPPVYASHMKVFLHVKHTRDNAALFHRDQSLERIGSGQPPTRFENKVKFD